MECTLKSVIVKLPSGNMRTQLRRKGKYISNTIRQRADADTWALEIERTIDKGLDPKVVNPRTVTTFSEIIDLHIQDMLEVGKRIRRSKSAVLELLKLNLGEYRLQEITRSMRSKELAQKHWQSPYHSSAPCSLKPWQVQLSKL